MASQRRLFDTDGVRGVTNKHPMTAEIALKIGKATAHVLGKGKQKPLIIIGKDTRLSGYMFETALTAGLCSMGARVLLVGPVPTPAIAHLTKSFAADAGIMVTASHNPSSHNGIKIFSGDGYKLPDRTEEMIERFVLDEEPEGVPGAEIGKAKRIDDARGRYTEFLKGCVRNVPLSGLKVVIDCANGASYAIAPQILQELGAQVFPIHCQPDGLNINRSCGATHPEALAEAVKRREADIGISLDGDADRIIMADAEGNIVDGDIIMAILACDMLDKKELNKKTLVATQYSNLALDRLIEAKGGKVVRVLNGDRYVIELMKDKGFNLGGEQSGHIIMSDHITTGDGMLAGLSILRIMKEKGKSIAELASILKPFPQVLESFPVKEKRLISEMEVVQKEMKRAEERLGDDGRILVRYSGTEMKARVMVEGKDKIEIEALCKRIADAIKSEVG